MAGRSEELETSVKVMVVARAALSVVHTEHVYMHLFRYMYVMYLYAVGHNSQSHDRKWLHSLQIEALDLLSLECFRARRRR